jgi:uncharacterized protein YdcH (DUF465 family)
MKKRVIMSLLLLAFATSALAIGSTIAQRNERQDRGQMNVSSPSGLKPKPANLERETPPQPAQPNPLEGQLPRQPEADVPEHVVYGQVFRHIKELHRKADEEERQGRDGAHFRKLYREMAKLDDRQAALLDEIAAEADGEIEKLNKRAMKIIGDLRAQHPEGKLATGEQPPAPPAELYELSAARRDRIHEARERLRAVFGEQEFERFNQFVRERVKPGIRRIGEAGAPQGR